MHNVPLHPALSPRLKAALLAAATWLSAGLWATPLQAAQVAGDQIGRSVQGVASAPMGAARVLRSEVEARARARAAGRGASTPSAAQALPATPGFKARQAGARAAARNAGAAWSRDAASAAKAPAVAPAGSASLRR